MVPGNRGCGLAVLAAMAMLAPSLAARSAIAKPIPRLPPVINRVRPRKLLCSTLNLNHLSLTNHRGTPKDKVIFTLTESSERVPGNRDARVAKSHHQRERMLLSLCT